MADVTNQINLLIIYRTDNDITNPIPAAISEFPDNIHRDFLIFINDFPWDYSRDFFVEDILPPPPYMLNGKIQARHKITKRGQEIFDRIPDACHEYFMPLLVNARVPFVPYSKQFINFANQITIADIDYKKIYKCFDEIDKLLFSCLSDKDKVWLRMKYHKLFN